MLKLLLALAFFFPAYAANAGIVYQLAGARCLDSNRPEALFPRAGLPDAFGVGETACSEVITANLVLSEAYSPGTSVNQINQPGTTLLIESFFANDGSRTVYTTFPIAPYFGAWGSAQADLPAQAGKALVDISWEEGWFFRTYDDGTWMMGLEFNAGSDVCGLNSVSGPYPSGLCAPSRGHYYSAGTYANWVRIPEPTSLLLTTVALLLLLVTRSMVQRHQL